MPPGAATHGNRCQTVAGRTHPWRGTRQRRPHFPRGVLAESATGDDHAWVPGPRHDADRHVAGRMHFGPDRARKPSLPDPADGPILWFTVRPAAAGTPGIHPRTRLRPSLSILLT